MSAATKLSNILLTAVLGASASAASATGAGVTNPTPPVPTNSQTNAAAYEKLFGSTAIGGQGGNAMAGDVSSTTVSKAPYVPPKILKERYNLGPCSGSAYQALWQTVKFSSIFSKHSVDGLVGVTDNSFTIRQFNTESDARRDWAVKAIDDKINPKPVIPAVIDPTSNVGNSQTSIATGGQGGNASATTSYTVPKTYKDVTYHCTLGR